MKPSIGRIVIYKLTTGDKANLKNSGADNPNNGADEAPAIITRVWSDACVNLKVMIDGRETTWVTSAVLGDGAGQWQWPARV